MPEKNITKVKVKYCPRCYGPHIYEMEDLHPQMIAANFTCPKSTKGTKPFKAIFERLANPKMEVVDDRRREETPDGAS